MYPSTLHHFQQKCLFHREYIPNRIPNGYDFRFEVREKSVDVNVIAGSKKTAVKARKSKMYVLYVED